MAPRGFASFIGRAESVQIDENDWRSQEEASVVAQLDEAEEVESTIQFSPEVHAELILTRDEYSDKERKACWYTPEEKAKMNAKHEKMVARFESGKSPRRGQTYRGLECWSVEGARELEATITRTIDAVMDEQDRQWKMFKDDYDLLAKVSMSTSGPAKQLAWEMARLDAQAVAGEHIPVIEDVSSSETGSDHLNEMPVPVEPAKKSSKSSKSNRRGEKHAKKQTKKGRRKDPPGNIRRDVSQCGSDLLKQMASVSHKFPSTNLSSNNKTSRGQGLLRSSRSR